MAAGAEVPPWAAGASKRRLLLVKGPGFKTFWEQTVTTAAASATPAHSRSHHSHTAVYSASSCKGFTWCNLSSGVGGEQQDLRCKKVAATCLCKGLKMWDFCDGCTALYRRKKPADVLPSMGGNTPVRSTYCEITSRRCFYLWRQMESNCYDLSNWGV